MIISHKKVPPLVNIQLQEEYIEVVNIFRLLGVTITSNLSWKQHITDITAKARKLLRFLFRLFKESGPSCLDKLYKSIVLPHLEYCSCVWDPLQKTYISMIERVKSFAARVSPGTGYKTQLILNLHWASLACNVDWFFRSYDCVAGSYQATQSFYQVSSKPHPANICIITIQPHSIFPMLELQASSHQALE